MVILACLNPKTTGKNSQTVIRIPHQKIQIYSRGKIELRNPNNPRLDKIETRVQNFRKFGKKVAAATHPTDLNCYYKFLASKENLTIEFIESLRLDYVAFMK